MQIKKVLRYTKEYGVRATLNKIYYKIGDRSMKENISAYQSFLNAHPLTEEMKAEQRNTKFSYTPTFSIVVPVYNVEEIFIRELLESVFAQTSSNWQLCFADGSETDALAAVITGYAPGDDRVLYRHLEVNGGISDNTNAAIAMATGEFIVLLDQDDLITEDAVYELTKAVNEHPELECMYSDEDKINADGTVLFFPHFKSDLNIDLLCVNNYITHLFCFKKSLFDRVGGFRKEFDGAQDHDLILRCVDEAKGTYHIPKVLYHWRTHENSTSFNPESKMYCYENGKRAIEEHFKRAGVSAEVSLSENYGYYTPHYLIQGNPLVSVVLTGDGGACEKTKKSIEAISDYRNLEFVFAKSWNEGARQATGEFLLFVKAGTKLSKADSIEELLGVCLRKDAGVVGSYISCGHKVAHAGLMVGNQAVSYSFGGDSTADFGYFYKRVCIHDLSAVALNAMMTSRKLFMEADGFEEMDTDLFSAVDYCLKVRAKSKLVIFQPFSEWQVKKSDREILTLSEKNCLAEKYGELFTGVDPYYNPNFNQQQADYSFRSDN